jgi:hypothetical protein
MLDMNLLKVFSFQQAEGHYFSPIFVPLNEYVIMLHKKIRFGLLFSSENPTLKLSIYEGR